jgi:hypothetical protein
MRHQLLAWLARQLQEQLERMVAAEVAKQLAERQTPAQPARRFIGQK